MIKEYKNTILEKLDQDDYASAYELCEYLRMKLIDSVCFNDVEGFEKILQYLNEIKNRVNEKVKSPKKEEEMDMSFLREMKEGLLNRGEKELQEFIEKLIRTSYYLGAVSGFVNSLCGIGSQFDEKSFVPHRTSFEDLLFLMSSPDSLSFMQAIHDEVFIEHADDTQTFIAELMERNLIKLDENKAVFLTNKGNDLIKYYEIWQNVEYPQYTTKIGQVRESFEIEESNLKVEDVRKIPMRLSSHPSIIPDIGRW